MDNAISPFNKDSYEQFKRPKQEQYEHVQSSGYNPKYNINYNSISQLSIQSYLDNKPNNSNYITNVKTKTKSTNKIIKTRYPQHIAQIINSRPAYMDRSQWLLLNGINPSTYQSFSSNNKKL